MAWCLGSGGWLMVTAMLLVLVAAVWLVTRLFPTATDPSALLDARLARGDVDVDTYRALRDELAGEVTRPAG